MAVTWIQPPSMQEFKTMLRRHNLRATRQRLAVHEVMMHLVHASADMVAEELSSRGGSRVSAASVYNILSQLSDLRIYERRLSAANKMFFDVNSSRHMHLYDHENHIWKDVVDEELQDLISAALRRRRFRGYTVEDLDIQFVARPTNRKNKHV